MSDRDTQSTGITDPGQEALAYDPSTVSWAVAEAVARPPSFVSRLSLYLILLAVCGTALFAYFAKVSITVSAKGAIRSTEKPRPIRSEVTGKAAKIAVANGDHVKKGQILIEMEQLFSAKERQEAQEYLAQIDEILKGKDDRKALEPVTELVAAPPRLSGEAGTRSIAGLIEALRGYGQALRNKHEVLPDVTRADSFELAQVQKKIHSIQALKSSALDRDLAELSTTAARLRVSITDRQQQAKTQLATTRTSLQVSARTFEESLKTQVESQQIVSPVDGVASSLTVAGPGELLSAGSTLLQIVPVGGRLVAELEIANKDIADIRAGLPVRIKLEALPFQDYGFLKGRVKEIPQDVTTKDGGKTEATYLVIASLDDEQLAGPTGEKRPVLLGMTLTADITTRQRTLLQLAVVEVLKLKGLF